MPHSNSCCSNDQLRLLIKPLRERKKKGKETRKGGIKRGVGSKHTWVVYSRQDTGDRIDFEPSNVSHERAAVRLDESNQKTILDNRPCLVEGRKEARSCSHTSCLGLVNNPARAARVRAAATPGWESFFRKDAEQRVRAASLVTPVEQENQRYELLPLFLIWFSFHWSSLSTPLEKSRRSDIWRRGWRRGLGCC